MKKRLALILALTMIASFTGCGGGSSSSQGNDSSAAETGTADAEAEASDTDADDSGDAADETAPEPTELPAEFGGMPIINADDSGCYAVMDDPDFSAKITGIESTGKRGGYLNMSLENRFDRTVRCGFLCLAAEGNMTDNLWFKDLKAGESAEDTCSWSCYPGPDVLEDPTEFTGIFLVVDAESGESLCEKSFAIHPYGESAVKRVRPEAQPTDVLAYESDAARIRLTGVKKDLGLYSLYLYVENLSDKTIAVQTDGDISVSGLPSDAYYVPSLILPGHASYDYIGINDDALTAIGLYGPHEIKDVDFQVKICSRDLTEVYAEGPASFDVTPFALDLIDYETYHIRTDDICDEYHTLYLGSRHDVVLGIVIEDKFYKSQGATKDALSEAGFEEITPDPAGGVSVKAWFEEDAEAVSYIMVIPRLNDPAVLGRLVGNGFFESISSDGSGLGEDVTIRDFYKQNSLDKLTKSEMKELSLHIDAFVK